MPGGTTGLRFSAGERTVRTSRTMVSRARLGVFRREHPPYGALDLTGNVWEWGKDWYAEDFYAVAPPHDPQGPSRGSFRVIRCGDWGQGPLELQTSYRGWDEMTYWGPTLGFRCAADAP